MGSLLGVFFISLASDEPITLLEEHHEQLFAFTSYHRRPEKTQNKTQWGFIGKVSLGLVDLVGIDRKSVAQALEKWYKTNTIPTLEAAAEHYVQRI